MPSPPPKDLHIGLCGGGIGGLSAAIAIARAGAKVTVLEAASELGEIGAGIQMTPNVARLLMKWGVDDVIGDNLVEFEELNMRRRDGTKVGYTRMVPNVRRDTGYPWWLVHRAHLHAGLVAVAHKHRADLIINARVSSIDHSSNEVTVKTEAGAIYTFDLLIGSDGINSTVRKTLFPHIKPRPPSTNCAYRAVVPYAQIAVDPIARELIEKPTMEVWMSHNAYIISYPISGRTVLNLVLSHHRNELVDQVQDADMGEFRDTYKDFDPRIKRVVDMIPQAQRWPLLLTGPLESWSNGEGNVVLMGDAAHSMTNHMAQGAATSMEDGAFLGRALKHVVSGELTIKEAIHIYEKARMPKAFTKQQVSFLNGAIWHLPDGEMQEARDKAMEPELRGEPFIRSPNLYGDPATVLSVYGYDAEADADLSIQTFLNGKEPGDGQRGVTRKVEADVMGWFLPKEKKSEKRAKL